MTASWTPRNFDVVRRGYAPQQVDETFAALVRDLTTLRDQRDAVSRQLAEAQSQLGQATAEAGDQPTYRGVGDRIERILRLAEEEADDLRTSTAAEIARDRGLAEQQIDRIREQADLYAKERRAQADAEATSILDSARREADTILEDAERTARNRRDEAENLFELNRGKAAQAAADFEITLAHRREQAERDFTSRMEAVEAQLVASEERAETLRVEAEALRVSTERKAAQVLEAARAQADEIVRDAAARATRSRSEAERELASMVQRRDSINLQLTNVRQMLATLTGSAPPIDPLAVGEPDVAAEYDDAATTGDDEGDADYGEVLDDVGQSDQAAESDDSVGSDEGVGLGDAVTSDEASDGDDAPESDETAGSEDVAETAEESNREDAEVR
jgi:hypothetical protein